MKKTIGIILICSILVTMIGGALNLGGTFDIIMGIFMIVSGIWGGLLLANNK